MKILAFDTSTEYCSAALWQDGELASRDVLAGQRHSELLLPMINEMLREAELVVRGLDGIAFGAGPGSFTGLRIACGVAQGLAFGADLPVSGICTLEALAQAAPGERIIACLDARMGEIYHAVYEKRDGSWLTLSEPGLYFPNEAPQVPEGEWVGCGSGFAIHGEALKNRYQGRLCRVAAGMVPKAREMAILAAPLFERGYGIDPALAAPLYIRNKVALKETER